MKEWLQKRYGWSLGAHIYRALDLALWVLCVVVLLGALNRCYAEEPRQQSWLVVVYYPYSENWMPRLKLYHIDREVCLFEAKHIYGPESKTFAVCVP